jgi:hypothetical protein
MSPFVLSLLSILALAAQPAAPPSAPGPAGPLPGDLPVAARGVVPPARQEQPIAARIRQLRSPVIGHPALVHAGERFAVWTTRRFSSARLLPADGCGAPVSLAPGVSTPEADGRLVRTEVRVPATTPRAAWHLEVNWEDGARTEEPLAVRTLGLPAGQGGGDAFRFAVMTDHQLLDPSWEVGDTAQAPAKRPWHGEKKANLAMT